MVWRGSVRDVVANQRPDNAKDEQDGIPWVLLICLLAMVLVLAIAIPLVGIVLMDANNATNAAITEIRKMRELRAKILLENVQKSTGANE
ncbi:MAG: hypothetical protein RL680_1013 [Actinomycetota bacterium]